MEEEKKGEGCGTISNDLTNMPMESQRRRKNGTEVFNDIMAKNFPKIMHNNVKPQIQEAWTIYPKGLNPPQNKTKTHLDTS